MLSKIHIATIAGWKELYSGGVEHRVSRDPWAGLAYFMSRRLIEWARSQAMKAGVPLSDLRRLRITGLGCTDDSPCIIGVEWEIKPDAV